MGEEAVGCMPSPPAAESTSCTIPARTLNDSPATGWMVNHPFTGLLLSTSPSPLLFFRRTSHPTRSAAESKSFPLAPQGADDEVDDGG